MLCCCKKGNSAYKLGEKGGQVTAINYNHSHIQTGKGALSDSNQSLGPEAELDKSTITATKQQQLQQGGDTPAAPITQQPVKNNVAPLPQTTSASEIQKPDNALELVDEKIDCVENSSNLCSSSPASSTPQHTTTISVGPHSNNRNSKAIETDLNLDREFDSIEAAVAEAEQQGSVQEIKSIVPELVRQVQNLTLQVTQAGKGHKMADQNLGSAVSRLEAVANRLEALAAKGLGGSTAGSAAGDELVPFVLEFDELLKNRLEKFLSLSNTIGGEVKSQAEMVKDAFNAQRELLIIASKSKKPSDDVLVQLVKPMGSKLEEINGIREANRHSTFSNHLFAVSESIGALGWVTIAPAPSPFVHQMLDAAMFYSNRILKDYKGKDQTHVDWVGAWKQVLLDLRDYVKASHTTGLSWNPQGGNAQSCKVSSAPAAAPSSGGPPPPPPPPPGPPPPVDDLPTRSSDPSDSAKSALFASINQGFDVSKGLKKVTDDMKTHKNPALRQGPAPFKPSSSPKPTPLPKPGAPSKPVATVKPPVLELQGKKWMVENHKNNKSIVIEGDIKQTVYAYKCEGSVISIKGKINSVVLDSCKKTALVFEDVLSSVEFVNCQSVQGQVTGKLNTLSIDKTDGCQFFLSKDSLSIEIVTAKSSEMNIMIPQDDGEFKEFPLPEQYKTTYNGKTVVTTVAESI